MIYDKLLKPSNEVGIMAKIMVVDDEQDIRDSVKTILETQGYEVLLSINGDDCVEQLSNKEVDLILLDIMMPGMPVREVVSRLSGTKIAFLTVVRTSEAEKESLLKNQNVVDFIQKPFDLDELIMRVKKALEV